MEIIVLFLDVQMAEETTSKCTSCITTLLLCMYDYS